MRKLFTACLMFVAVAANSTESDYVLEVGVGAVAGQLPKYAGSSEDYNFVLPFPYIYYRDERLTLDKEAVTGTLLKNADWRLSLTASGALPVKEAKRRQGMPELGWVGRAGPQLEYQIHPEWQLIWRLHKAVAISDWKLQNVGWVGDMALTWEKSLASEFLPGRLVLTAQASLSYADHRHQGYYYDVAPQYSLADRPTFSASSGLMGTGASLGLTWRHQDWWLGAYVKYSNLTHNQNVASPLLEEQHQLNAGIALAKVLWTNQRGR